MKQKLLINLLLLAVVAGLGLIAWLQPGKQPEAVLERLTGRQPGSVTRLEIEHPDGRRLTFQRRDGQWRMTAPYRMPGNSIKLDALARVVEAPILSGFGLPARDRLADFGLDKPFRLRLDDQLFDFGGNDPINFHRYVAFGGRLALIVDRFHHHLTAAAEQLLSHSILPAGSNIQSIKTPSYRLFQGEAGWQLEPAVSELSGDDLSGHAAQWARAQGLVVKHFDNPGSDRLVEIGLSDGRSMKFIILQQEEKQWLVRSDNGLGYQLPADSPLLAPPESPKPQPDA